MSTNTDRPRPARRWIFVLLAVVAVIVAGLLAFGKLPASPAGSTESRCTAAGESGEKYSLDPEQADNAALIAAGALAKGLNHRAAVVALATAQEESGLSNLEHGAHGSLGLFQQRPADGWGTAEQILDRHYATSAFYTRLMKVDYNSLSVTQAAQSVQGSGTPGGYAKHEASAAALADAFTGTRPASFTCTLSSAEPTSTYPGEYFSQPVNAVAYSLEQDFKDALGKVVKQGENLVVEPTSNNTGWAAAHWAVANADVLNIVRVSHQGQTWDRSRQLQEDAPGWEPVENVMADGEQAPHAQHVVITTAAVSE